MNDDIREFALDLGRRAIARDWSGVHSLLAPWLQQTTDPAAVQRFFEDEYRLTLKDNGVEAMHYPEYPEPQVDGNSFTNATTLREPMSFKPGYVRPLAEEVTDENFRYWLSLQLLCSDEQMQQFDFDRFAEIWIAVVATAAGLRVGYWNHDPY